MSPNSAQETSCSQPMPDTALVLAGGLGIRLRKAVTDRPKALAPAAGRPFLGYLLDYLANQGIAQVVLCTGYLAEQVHDYVQDGKRWGLQVQYSIESSPLGTGGALRQAASNLPGSEYFALNGDTLFQVDLKGLWNAHLELSTDATLAIRPVGAAESAERGCVRLAKDGRILSFNEKLDGLAQPNSALTNGGIYVLKRSTLDAIQPDRKISLERQVFPPLATQGKLAGHIQRGYFVDIGTPHSLAAFEADIKARRVPEVKYDTR